VLKAEEDIKEVSLYACPILSVVLDTHCRSWWETVQRLLILQGSSLLAWDTPALHLKN